MFIIFHVMKMWFWMLFHNLNHCCRKKSASICTWVNENSHCMAGTEWECVYEWQIFH